MGSGETPPIGPETPKSGGPLEGGEPQMDNQQLGYTPSEIVPESVEDSTDYFAQNTSHRNTASFN